MKPRLYFAAPLFSSAERRFNSELAGALEGHFDVFLPQRDGGLVTDLVAVHGDVARARRAVFDQDLEALRVADVFLIVLDGRAVDEGASFELGFAFALGKRCVGVQTDPRRLLASGNNPMIDQALSETFDTVDGLLDWASTNYRRKG